MCLLVSCSLFYYIVFYLILFYSIPGGGTTRTMAQPSSWYNTPIHSDRTSIPVSPSSSDRQRNGHRKTPHKAHLRLRWLLLGRCLFPNTHTYTQCRFGTNAVNSEFNGVSRFGEIVVGMGRTISSLASSTVVISFK